MFNTDAYRLRARQDDARIVTLQAEFEELRRRGSVVPAVYPDPR